MPDFDILFRGSARRRLAGRSDIFTRRDRLRAHLQDFGRPQFRASILTCGWLQCRKLSFILAIEDANHGTSTIRIRAGVYIQK
jgi:hypothetical protein